MELIYVVGLIGFLSLSYTYFIYPIIMWMWTKLSKQDMCVCGNNGLDPAEIAVVMSVYNEEKFIVRRIEQLRNLKYGNKVLIAIGSDGSTDKTNKILQALQEKYENIKVFVFPRQGKAATINAIMKSLPENINYVILTDAKTFSDKNTIEVLVSVLQDQSVGLAMPWLKTTNSSEELYFDTEIKLKCYESKVFGYCAGAFGNMYAIKRELFASIPNNFVVDDLFVTLQIVLKRYRIKVCSNTSSYVIPTNVKREFQRRRRIAAGNWQIIKWMTPKLFKFPLSFLFILLSHKVLRWLGPIWILSIIIFVIALMIKIPMIVFPSLILMIFILLVRATRDLAIRFLVLNAALLMGFIDFLFSKQHGLWQPTQRELEV